MTKKKRQPSYPAAFLQRLRAVTAIRPKTVIDHILKFGYITTEQLRDTYNYDHPPRAVRDVRELGIPLVTFKVKGSHGRMIAAYKFGDPSQTRAASYSGRKAWPKLFKQDLLAAHGARCAICSTEFEGRLLQIDHRVPYEVCGDPDDEFDPADFLLVCSSCNRAKSWSCEHCKNWTDDRDVDVCRSCYWAAPTNHSHVALRLIRRVDLTWADKDVADYERLLALSMHARQSLPEFVKKSLRRVLDTDA